MADDERSQGASGSGQDGSGTSSVVQDQNLAVLLRALKKATNPRPIAVSKVVINGTAQSEGILKLETEIAEVTVENLTGGVVDVFLGSDAGSMGFPDFSVANNQAKRVPLTSSSSTAVTLVPRTRGGVIRAWASNDRHGYAVWTITV